MRQGPGWLFAGVQRAEFAARLQPADLSARLERARSLMHQAVAAPLTNDDFARSAALSPHYFSRAFKRAYGLSPLQYRTQRRLDRAKRLLQRGEMSVTEVCFELGFSSLGSFTTMFTRHVGESPGRLQRSLVQSLGVPAAQPAIPMCFFARYAPLPGAAVVG